MGGGGGLGGSIEPPPKFKKLTHYNTLPQNVGNPISEDLSFKNYGGLIAAVPYIEPPLLNPLSPQLRGVLIGSGESGVLC